MRKKKQQKVEKFDPKDCNVPNINFSLIGDNDDRYEDFKKQRLERGFDESETWSLDYTIARFIAPRLRAFLDIYKAVIVDDRNMVPVIERALKAFERLAQDTVVFGDECEEIDEALVEFAKIFRGLWW